MYPAKLSLFYAILQNCSYVISKRYVNHGSFYKIIVWFYIFFCRVSISLSIPLSWLLGQ